MIYERGRQRRLHNEKLHNLSSSSNNIKAIQRRRMNRRRHCSIHGETRNAYNIFVRYHFGDLGIDRMFILTTSAFLFSAHP
jgi:hypothetical protein